MTDRKPRDLESRQQVQRTETWMPPEHLPEPIRQEGWEYRWVRTAVMGDDDPMNVLRSRREGWEAEKASLQPHMEAMRDQRTKDDNIEIGGLMLCKAPLEHIHKRKAYYENMTRQQQASVDNNLMKEQDARMPLFKDSRSKVTFGTGE